MSKHIKLSLFLFFVFVFSQSSFGQVVSPPKWNIQLASKDLKVGDEVKVVFKASIPRDWYIYSNDFDPDLGPTLTTLKLSEISIGFELVGGLKAINPKKKFDTIWEGDITYFEGTGTFEQTIKITSENINIVGLLDYQMCTDLTGRCVTYEEDFSINSTAKATEVNSSAPVSSLEENNSIDTISDSPLSAKEPVQEKAEDTDASQERTFVDLEAEASSGGLLGFMFVAFLAGLAALLTPCVFPMIAISFTFCPWR